MLTKLAISLLQMHFTCSIPLTARAKHKTYKKHGNNRYVIFMREQSRLNNVLHF